MAIVHSEYISKISGPSSYANIPQAIKKRRSRAKEKKRHDKRELNKLLSENRQLKNTQLETPTKEVMLTTLEKVYDILDIFKLLYIYMI